MYQKTVGCVPWKHTHPWGSICSMFVKVSIKSRIPFPNQLLQKMMTWKRWWLYCHKKRCFRLWWWSQIFSSSLILFPNIFCKPPNKVFHHHRLQILYSWSCVKLCRRLDDSKFSVYSESPKVENDEQGKKRYPLQPKLHIFTSIPSTSS